MRANYIYLRVVFRVWSRYVLAIIGNSGAVLSIERMVAEKYKSELVFALGVDQQIEDVYRHPPIPSKPTYFMKFQGTVSLAQNSSVFANDSHSCFSTTYYIILYSHFYANFYFIFIKYWRDKLELLQGLILNSSISYLNILV